MGLSGQASAHLFLWPPESEAPNFFTGRRGVFQGDWQGAGMSVSPSQAIWAAVPPFVSRAIRHRLI